VPISAAEPLLDVHDLKAGYGKIGVLHGVDFHIKAGEVVTLLGPNGAGKTTFLRALSGLLPHTGSIRFAGVELGDSGSRAIAKAGLVHVIEGHRIFTLQSVADNLLLAAYDCPAYERAARIEEALSYFPEIAAKCHDRGSALSGGQQQMLVVAQGLVRRPRLLMLDEPSAGLSPILVDRVLNVVHQLRKAGTAVLLVEQLVEKALAIADRAYAIAKGKIVFEAKTDESNLAKRLEEAYFGESLRPIAISEKIRAQGLTGAA
jgi:branched-chain amino acid transport system ATP-binding protein